MGPITTRPLAPPGLAPWRRVTPNTAPGGTHPNPESFPHHGRTVPQVAGCQPTEGHSYFMEAVLGRHAGILQGLRHPVLYDHGGRQKEDRGIIIKTRKKKRVQITSPNPPQNPTAAQRDPPFPRQERASSMPSYPNSYYTPSVQLPLPLQLASRSPPPST